MISRIIVIQVLQSRSRYPLCEKCRARLHDRLIAHRGNKETSREPKRRHVRGLRCPSCFTQNNAIHSGGKHTVPEQCAGSVIITAMWRGGSLPQCTSVPAEMVWADGSAGLSLLHGPLPAHTLPPLPAGQGAELQDTRKKYVPFL